MGSGTGVVFVVLGSRISGGKPGGFPEKHELDLSLPVHERNKAALLSLSKQYTCTNEYGLNRETCPGIQSVPPADLAVFLCFPNIVSPPSGKDVAIVGVLLVYHGCFLPPIPTSNACLVGENPTCSVPAV